MIRRSIPCRIDCVERHGQSVEDREEAAGQVAKAAVTAAVIEEVNQGLANGSGSRTCVIS